MTPSGLGAGARSVVILEVADGSGHRYLIYGADWLVA